MGSPNFRKTSRWSCIALHCQTVVYIPTNSLTGQSVRKACLLTSSYDVFHYFSSSYQLKKLSKTTQYFCVLIINWLLH